MAFVLLWRQRDPDTGLPHHHLGSLDNRFRREFRRSLRREFPKAAAKITEDEDELLAFYDYPAEHWVHLRTTNPIESTFATVRLRTKVTKGHGSKAAGLAMAFKLIESASGAGAWSTPRTWSRWSGPERPSSTASSPNARTIRSRRTRPPRRPDHGHRGRLVSAAAR